MLKTKQGSFFVTEVGIRVPFMPTDEKPKGLDVYEQAKIKIAYYKIGIAYARLQKYERSLWPFTRCIEINPYDTKYFMERGKALQVLEQFD